MRRTAETPSFGLRTARWIVLALVAASLLAAALSLLLAPAYVPAHVADYELTSTWTPELVQAALAQLGWPAATVAWFEFIRGGVLTLGALLPGLLILRRRSHDWFGLYMAITFVVVPALSVTDPIAGRLPGLRAVQDLAGAFAWQLYFVLFYVFPDGQFVPRWTRWLLLGWVGINVVALSLPAQVPAPVWLAWAPVPLVILAVAGQVYRYFWVSGPLARQQTKWVVFMLAVLLTMLPVGFANQGALSAGQPLGSALLLALLRLVVVNLAFVMVAIAIGIAILRYRLWDIDVVIRRTLIYTVLSALLALAYFGSILLLQAAFGGFTGNAQTPLVTVLSTLAIAALFFPLRARVQAFIDRRFYRRKYDAARTLAAFAATARDETDLPRLTAQLAAVVQDTMQPEQVTLWLKRNEPTRSRP